MKTQTATVSRDMNAPADRVYKIIADYRNTHPLILPKRYFLSLDVEAGDYGAGTIVNFTMRILGRTQSFRSLITEPEPGRLLVETDIKSQTPTSFQVLPAGDGARSKVTISTALQARNLIEGFLGKLLLQRVYREELGLLARVAENQTDIPDPSTTGRVDS